MDFHHTFTYLTNLSQNNNRDWFNANKEQYLLLKEQFELFTAQLISDLAGFDPSIKGLDAKKCVFRIYRDTRFSKNKTPYKINMGAYLVPGGKKSGNAGYYLHIEPGGSMIAGGIHMPPSPVLKAIRDNVFDNVDELKIVLNNKEFKNQFPTMTGDKLKTAPKGFPKEWEEIEMLKFKSYTVFKSMKDEDVISDKFYQTILNSFKVMKPFNDFLNKSF
jgi:uncharacterized protein (TIGR02453 family)